MVLPHFYASHLPRLRVWAGGYDGARVFGGGKAYRGQFYAGNQRCLRAHFCDAYRNHICIRTNIFRQDIYNARGRDFSRAPLPRIEGHFRLREPHLVAGVHSPRVLRGDLQGGGEGPARPLHSNAAHSRELRAWRVRGIEGGGDSQLPGDSERFFCCSY